MGPWRLMPLLLTILATNTVVSGLVVIPAVGRMARIGEMYDAVTDSFRGVTIFRKELNSSIVATLDTPLSEVSQMRVTKLRDKANLLRVSATITIGIYCGLIELSGTAEYLREEKESSSEQAQVFSYSVRTTRDVLQDYGEDLKEFISPDALNVDATHVVTAVDYGADVFIEFTSKNATESKQEDVFGELGLYFRKYEAIATAKATAYVNHSTIETNIDKALSIRIFGDLAIEKEYPLSIETVEAFLRKVPESVKKGTQGNPVSYTIAPIDQFRKKFAPNLLSFSKTASTVNETQSYEFLIIFEEIEDVRAKMNEMSEQFKINEDFIPYENMTSLEELKFSFEQVVLTLKKNVSAGLIRVREGDDEAMQQIKKDYEDNPFSGAKVGAMIRTQYEAAIEKSVEIENFRKYDIEVVGRTGSVQDILLKYSDRTIQMLFMTPNYKSDPNSNWASTVALLLRPLKNQLNKLVMVDCSFSNSFCPEKSVIKQFYNGKIHSEDVFQDFEKTDGNILHMVGMGTENKLGDLFDARTGKFKTTTILDYFDPGAEFEDEDATLEYSTFVPENFNDLFESLKIPMWQGGNILASGKGIFGFGETSDTLMGFVSFVRKNSTKTLSLTAKPSFVETDIVFQEEVTHYVSEVEVATIDVFAFQVNEVPEVDRQLITSQLKEDLGNFSNLFSKFQEDDEDITKLQLGLKYSKIQIFTNFGEFPVEFQTTSKFLEHLSKNKQEEDDDPYLFLPIRMTLQPVSTLHESLKFFIPTPPYTEISLENEKQIVKGFEKIQSISNEHQEFRNLFHKFRQVARNEDYKNMMDVSLQLEAEIEYWRRELYSVIQNVRHAEEKEENLDQVLQQFLAADIGKSNYFHKKLPVLSKKLPIASKAEELGIRYLGRNNWFPEIFMSQRVSVSVAMVDFQNLGEKSGLDLDGWMSTRNETSAFIVDCDFFLEECLGVNGFNAREYSHGTLQWVSQGLEDQVKEVSIGLNSLTKQMEVVYGNLTRHYEVLKDFTEHFLIQT